MSAEPDASRASWWIDSLVETWLVNNRINLTVLEQLSQEALETTLSTRGGRTVGMELAHLLDNRRRHLDKRDPERAARVPVVTREQGHDRERLRDGFEASGEEWAQLLRAAAEEGGAVKGNKRGVLNLMSYLMAHDAHHRGRILLTLKAAGVKRPKDLGYAIWDWSRI